MNSYGALKSYHKNNIQVKDYSMQEDELHYSMEYLRSAVQRYPNRLKCVVTRQNQAPVTT